MKKSIFEILFCITACFVGHSVFASDVGGKSPTKTEISVANDNVVADYVFAFQNTSDTYFSADGSYIVSAQKNDNFNYLSNEVSVPKGDAAIPIRAQASYSKLYSKTKLSIKTTYDPLWDYNLERYWC